MPAFQESIATISHVAVKPSSSQEIEISPISEETKLKLENLRHPFYNFNYIQEFGSEEYDGSWMPEESKVEAVKIEDIHFYFAEKLQINYYENGVQALLAPLRKMTNLKKIEMNFARFTRRTYEALLQELPNISTINIRFGIDLNHRNFAIEFKNGLVYYKNKEKVWVVKASRAKIVISPACKVYYGDKNVYVFEECAALEMDGVKMQDDGKKLFEYYLKKVEKNWFEKRGNYRNSRVEIDIFKIQLYFITKAIIILLYTLKIKYN